MDFVSLVHDPLKNEGRPCIVVTVTFSTIYMYVNLASLTTSFGTCIFNFLVQNKNKIIKMLTNSVRSKQYCIFNLF